MLIENIKKELQLVYIKKPYYNFRSERKIT